jgi:hypothetical protein
VTMMGLAAALLVLLAACSPSSVSETPFARQASDAASSISAAATTLEYLHAGKLDTRYATSSLDIYREMLQKIAPELPGQGGAPDESTLRPVLDTVRQAQDVLDDPCLTETCDWQGQIDTLHRAQQALLEVSE